MIHIAAVSVECPCCSCPTDEAEDLVAAVVDDPILDCIQDSGCHSHSSAVERQMLPIRLDSRPSCLVPSIPSCSLVERSSVRSGLASFQLVPVDPSAIQPTDLDLDSSCDWTIHREALPF